MTGRCCICERPVAEVSRPVAPTGNGEYYDFTPDLVATEAVYTGGWELSVDTDQVAESWSLWTYAELYAAHQGSGPPYPRAIDRIYFNQSLRYGFVTYPHFIAYAGLPQRLTHDKTLEPDSHLRDNTVTVVATIPLVLRYGGGGGTSEIWMFRVRHNGVPITDRILATDAKSVSRANKSYNGMQTLSLSTFAFAVPAMDVSTGTFEIDVWVRQAGLNDLSSVIRNGSTLPYRIYHAFPFFDPLPHVARVTTPSESQISWEAIARFGQRKYRITVPAMPDETETVFDSLTPGFTITTGGNWIQWNKQALVGSGLSAVLKKWTVRFDYLREVPSVHVFFTASGEYDSVNGEVNRYYTPPDSNDYFLGVGDRADWNVPGVWDGNSPQDFTYLAPSSLVPASLFNSVVTVERE
jgi:hypothetical protein